MLAVCFMMVSNHIFMVYTTIQLLTAHIIQHPVAKWLENNNNNNNHYCQTTVWAIAFLTRFCQIWSGVHFFGFRNNNKVQPPQPAGPGPHIYVPQWQGGPVIPLGTGFPYRHLLRLAELRHRYSNPPQHGEWLQNSQMKKDAEAVVTWFEVMWGTEENHKNRPSG
jgi:hypothetical protein